VLYFVVHYAYSSCIVMFARLHAFEYKFNIGMLSYLADDCLAVSANPLTPDYYPYQGQGPRYGRGVSRSQAQSSRTTALQTATLSPPTFARHLKAHLFGWSIARLRIIYDALYKSTHHHYHHHYHVNALFWKFNFCRHRDLVESGHKNGLVDIAPALHLFDAYRPTYLTQLLIDVSPCGSRENK